MNKNNDYVNGAYIARANHNKFQQKSHSVIRNYIVNNSLQLHNCKQSPLKILLQAQHLTNFKIMQHAIDLAR